MKEIILIYLPHVTSAESEKAEKQLLAIEARYALPTPDCRQIVRSYMGIFRRLIRIDPVLRRPNPQSEPFAIDIQKRLTRAEAKAELRKLHVCFDKSRVPSVERRAYFKALAVHAYELFQSVQAEVQMRTESPSLQ